MNIATVPYHGWKHNTRLSNEEVELIITQDVGPRILRFGFIGEENIFGEIQAQSGGSNEKEWMIRGGHRLWIAPEEKPKSYELDNSPVDIEETENGIKTIQPVGPLTGVQKSMQISLADQANEVIVLHRLTNMNKTPVELAPWALTVMGLQGMAIIPLPGKIPHTDRLTHNQGWSLWGYTDLSDPRWTIGSKYLFFRQDPERGPNKLGIAHSEGWAAYLRNSTLFIKRFKRIDNAVYPDGGVNFETFSNQEILEMESIGPLVTLAPGKSAVHQEIWSLHRNIPECQSESDVDDVIVPLVSLDKP